MQHQVLWHLDQELSLFELDLAAAAPFDGVFGNKNVQVGDFVSTGIRLGALVPTDDLYIVANFKETDLDRLGVGAKVKVSVDAFEEDNFTGTMTFLTDPLPI